jgi:hypothetical protein
MDIEDDPAMMAEAERFESFKQFERYGQRQLERRELYEKVYNDILKHEYTETFNPKAKTSFLKIVLNWFKN